MLGGFHHELVGLVGGHFENVSYKNRCVDKLPSLQQLSLCLCPDSRQTTLISSAVTLSWSQFKNINISTFTFLESTRDRPILPLKKVKHEPSLSHGTVPVPTCTLETHEHVQVLMSVPEEGSDSAEQQSSLCRDLFLTWFKQSHFSEDPLFEICWFGWEEWFLLLHAVALVLFCVCWFDLVKYRKMPEKNSLEALVKRQNFVFVEHWRAPLRTVCFLLCVSSLCPVEFIQLHESSQWVYVCARSSLHKHDYITKTPKYSAQEKSSETCQVLSLCTTHQRHTHCSSVLQLTSLYRITVDVRFFKLFSPGAFQEILTDSVWQSEPGQAAIGGESWPTHLIWI